MVGDNHRPPAGGWGNPLRGHPADAHAGAGWDTGAAAGLLRRTSAIGDPYRVLKTCPPSPVFRAVRFSSVEVATMFASFTTRESPLFGEFQRLEQQLDELFGGATPWAGGIRSLPPGTFPAVNVAGSADSV